MIPGIMPVIAGGDTRDEYFSNVTLLMHMDGANNGTVFTDSSSYGAAITRSGNTITSTADKKFGTASAYFDGSGDALSATYTAAKFRWWGTPSTMECWVKPSAFPSLPNVISNGNLSNATTPWRFGPVTSGALALRYVSSSTQRVVTSGTGKIATGAWQHIAMTFDGSNIRLFVGGNLEVTQSIAGTPVESTGLGLSIGAVYGSGYNGYVDDLRITNGIARYTSSFTPPNRAFPDE